MNAKAIFDTHGADTELNCRSGQTVIRLIKPDGWDRTILLSDRPLEIGEYITLNNGYGMEIFKAIGKERTDINGKNHIKVTVEGTETTTIKNVYYREN